MVDTTIVIDPVNGAAGDMITAALIDAGADKDLVMRAMASVVNRPTITEVMRAGIRSLQIETHAPHFTRCFDEIIQTVNSADAPSDAIEMAKNIFNRIYRAEEAVHGHSPHFHEVGADDAVADVIGACTALISIRPDAVVTLPIPLGDGSVPSSHGLIPVPGPATLHILMEAGLNIRFGPPGSGELCTPTGAAIIAEFTKENIRDIPGGMVSAIGNGAGTRNPVERPNILRIIIIKSEEEQIHDYVDLLETNVDDVSGEVLGNAIEALMNAGAKDTCVIPCTMKKGRTGNLVRVICSQDDSSHLAELLATELGTLGIRCIPHIHRFIAERSIHEIEVEIRGEHKKIPVKFGWSGKRCYSVKAEFEAAKEWAISLGLSPREVCRVIEEFAWRYVNTDKIN